MWQHTWLLVGLRTGLDYMSLNGFVVPDKRGQRLLADVKGFAARHFATEGYRRNISVVHSGNRASVRAHATVAAKPLASLQHMRIGKLSIIARDHGRPRVMWGTEQPFRVTL